jgi:hypothetical protein
MIIGGTLGRTAGLCRFARAVDSRFRIWRTYYDENTREDAGAHTYFMIAGHIQLAYSCTEHMIEGLIYRPCGLRESRRTCGSRGSHRTCEALWLRCVGIRAYHTHTIHVHQALQCAVLVLSGQKGTERMKRMHKLQRILSTCTTQYNMCAKIRSETHKCRNDKHTHVRRSCQRCRPR